MANIINEILIADDFEESVIDVEYDGSTMTSEPLKKKTRKSNILELISDQRNGNKNRRVFNSEVISFMTSKIKMTNLFPTVHPEIHVADCEYIRSGQDGRCILGVWKGDQYDTILYKIALHLSPRGSTVEDDMPNFLKGIERIGPFFSKTDIVDICDTNCQNEKYELYVGSYYNENFVKQSSAVLCSFTNSSATTGKQYVSLKELSCCCGSQNGDVFATGSEDGVLVYQDQEFIFHNRNIGRVNSVEFNSTGNVLYCGVSNSRIKIFDRREPLWKNSKIDSLKFSSGISETKLFSNDNNMVVSSLDGHLFQIDLRKRKIVVNYPGYAVVNKKTPFSLSEHADILCSTGTDQLTRLWSLRTGSQLCAIAPQFKANKVHSCLIADECRWLVAIFKQDSMCIMEPKG